MKKAHYTAEIPVSNPYNFAAFEDLIANIQSGYNEEKRLKNAAFEFMINKGYTSISTNGCTTPPAAPKRKYPGTVPHGYCRGHPDRKIFRAVNAPRPQWRPACISEGRFHIAHPRLRIA